MSESEVDFCVRSGALPQFRSVINGVEPQVMSETCGRKSDHHRCQGRLEKPNKLFFIFFLLTG